MKNTGRKLRIKWLLRIILLVLLLAINNLKKNVKFMVGQLSYELPLQCTIFLTK